VVTRDTATSTNAPARPGKRMYWGPSERERRRERFLSASRRLDPSTFSLSLSLSLFRNVCLCVCVCARARVSSYLPRVLPFFASQTLHNRKNLKKKSGDVNDEANFSLFILLQERAKPIYPPPPSLRARTQTFTPPLHPSLHHPHPQNPSVKSMALPYF
jgi:hypothetical protein